MKSINIALIAILVLVAPIFAAEDAYATVCHGKNMTDNKFGEFVANFFEKCSGDFADFLANHDQEAIKDITKDIKQFTFYNGTDQEINVINEDKEKAIEWCTAIFPVNNTAIAPNNVSMVWEGLKCNELVELLKKNIKIEDKDECWKAVKKIHNNRCYWRWNEYLTSEQRDLFESIRDEVHSIDWLYLFMVIIGSVIGSFVLTLILGLIMNLVKKQMHKKAE